MCIQGIVKKGDGYTGPMRADAVFGPESGYYCGYAYALVSANRASLKRLNTFVSAEYELSDNVDAFVDILISDNESFGRYAPPAAAWPRDSWGSKKYRWGNLRLFPLDGHWSA